MWLHNKKLESGSFSQGTMDSVYTGDRLFSGHTAAIHPTSSNRGLGIHWKSEGFKIPTSAMEQWLRCKPIKGSHSWPRWLVEGWAWDLVSISGIYDTFPRFPGKRLLLFHAGPESALFYPLASASEGMGGVHIKRVRAGSYQPREDTCPVLSQGRGLWWIHSGERRQLPELVFHSPGGHWLM